VITFSLHTSESKNEFRIPVQSSPVQCVVVQWLVTPICDTECSFMYSRFPRECINSTQGTNHIVSCPDPTHMRVRRSGYTMDNRATSPNPWARFRIWKRPMRSRSGAIRILRSERIYVPPCESSSFTILWLYVLCAFRTFSNSWKSLYIHTVLVAIVGPYTFEDRIHKVAVELPNIVEGLVGVQLCTLYFKSV